MKSGCRASQVIVDLSLRRRRRSWFLFLFSAGLHGTGICLRRAIYRPPANPTQEVPPAALGWAFVGLGIFLFLLGVTFALVLALAGRSLSRRRRYWFAFVVACIECIFIPFGTILGVFTIIVLSRESVKTLFRQRKRRVKTRLRTLKE